MLSRTTFRLLATTALLASLGTPAYAKTCLQQVQDFSLEHQLELAPATLSDTSSPGAGSGLGNSSGGGTAPDRQWSSDPLLVEPSTHSIYDNASVPGTASETENPVRSLKAARTRIETDVIEALLTGARDEGLRGNETDCLARLEHARETLEVYR